MRKWGEGGGQKVSWYFIIIIIFFLKLLKKSSFLTSSPHPPQRQTFLTSSIAPWNLFVCIELSQMNATIWCHCLQTLPIGSDMEIMRSYHICPNSCKTWRKMADLRNGLPIWSCCRISCNNFHTFANYAPQAFFSFTAYLETNRFLPTLNTTIPCYPIYATQALFSFIPHSISAVQA